MFGGSNAPVQPVNPMSSGAPVSNSPAGNAYLGANPQLAGGQGAGVFGAQGQAIPFMTPGQGAQGGIFGSQGAGGGMYGSQSAPQIFGPMGAGSSAPGAVGTSSTPEAVGAASASPSTILEWLQSKMDFL
jgi:hypothetical protein